ASAPAGRGPAPGPTRHPARRLNTPTAQRRPAPPTTASAADDVSRLVAAEAANQIRAGLPRVPTAELSCRWCGGARLELFEGAAGAAGDGGERVIGDSDDKSGFLAQELVKAAQECAAADQREAAVGDVGREFGRRALEQLLDGVDDARERPLQGALHLGCADGGAAQEAGCKVTAGDLCRLESAAVGEGCADLDLHRLGLFLADQQPLLVLEEPDDGVVEVVAADADRLRDGEAAEGGDGHLRGAAADVNHERSDRLCDRQPGTDRGRERLFDQVGAGCARRQRRLLDRRTLDLSRTARDADHYLGP